MEGFWEHYCMIQKDIMGFEKGVKSQTLFVFWLFSDQMNFKKLDIFFATERYN